MDLLDIYRGILHTAGMVADEEGFISAQFGKVPAKPVLVKGKRLVLPTPEQLRNPDFSNRVRFHPLNESIIRGESDVLVKYREILTTRLTFSITYVAINLLMIATSPAQHSDLTPEQALFLNKVKDANEGTLDRLKEIATKMLVAEPNKGFLHFYIRKNAKINGKEHRRAGIVSFPFYEEIRKTPEPKQPNEVYGVKLRKVDRESLKALMEFMFPGIDKPETFNRGSQFDEVAPSLEALLRSAIAVGDCVNTVIELFKDKLEDAEDVMFVADWDHILLDMNALLPKIRMIPMQQGNEGNMPAVPGQAAAPLIPVPEKTTTEPPQRTVVRGLEGGLGSQNPQHYQTAPAAPAESLRPPAGGLAATSHRAAPPEPSPHHAPVLHHPMAPNPNYPQPQYPYPHANYQQPQYPAQQHQYQPPAPTPTLRRTANGLDFDSVIQSNPVMQQQMYNQQQQYGSQYAVPARRVPNWDYAARMGNHYPGAPNTGFSGI